MDFKWLNEGTVKTDGNKIELFAPAQSDFFFNNGAIGEEGITPNLPHLPTFAYYHSDTTVHIQAVHQ